MFFFKNFKEIRNALPTIFRPFDKWTIATNTSHRLFVGRYCRCDNEYNFYLSLESLKLQSLGPPSYNQFGTLYEVRSHLIKEIFYHCFGIFVRYLSSSKNSRRDIELVLVHCCPHFHSLNNNVRNRVCLDSPHNTTFFFLQQSR